MTRWDTSGSVSRIGIDPLGSVSDTYTEWTRAIYEEIGARNVTEQDWRGKIGGLQSTEMADFLAEGHIARLACNDDNDYPYVVPCWHEWDGEAFWVVPRKKSAWATYLERDPRCAITVDEDGALRKVIAQCKAEMIEGPNIGGQWVGVAERMSVRYLGPNGPSYLEPTLDKPRWLFRLEPIRLWTWQGVDWAKSYKEED